jgi:hypothetical protein
MLPLADLGNKSVSADVPKILGRLGKISRSALHQRACADAVSPGLVMKSYRQLYQTLQVLFLQTRRGSPNVLQDLVGLKKSALVEQADTANEPVTIHAQLWHVSASHRQMPDRCLRNKCRRDKLLGTKQIPNSVSKPPVFSCFQNR